MQIVFLLVSGLFFCLVLHFVHLKTIRGRYAVLWMTIGFVIFGVSMLPFLMAV